jgi:hypothetical protein
MSTLPTIVNINHKSQVWWRLNDAILDLLKMRAADINAIAVSKPRAQGAHFGSDNYLYPAATEATECIVSEVTLNYGLKTPTQQQVEQNKAFLEYLLNWPEMSDEELNTIEEKRKQFNAWK